MSVAPDATIPVPALVAAGVLARSLGMVLAGSAVLPELTPRIRFALALALAVVSFPQALVHAGVTAAPAAGFAGGLLVTAGEALVGIGLGAAVAAIASAGGWAGGILGSAAGLSWADDFDPDGDAQSAGMARLAWWISCGVFLAAGGLETIVAGAIDGVRHLPVGSLLPAAGAPRLDLARLAGEAPATALALCVALAVPSLLAVLAFHLATAIAVRTVPFATGPGFLQSLAAVVLLGAVSLGAETWVRGFPLLVQGPIERLFGAP
ncbi:MAG: type III secretion protein [Planctomycetia bacterium]|nr:type III secretion protein [Planctomycetia bacterium]